MTVTLGLCGFGLLVGAGTLAVVFALVAALKDCDQ